MQQSNIIFGALLVAFIVFITTRGELPTYLSLLRGSGNANAGAPTGTSTSTSNVISTIENNVMPNSPLASGEQSLSNAQQLLDLFGE